MERPYRIRADRILAGESRVEDLDKREIRFEDSPEYGTTYKFEHLRTKEIAGKELNKLRFV